jgi:lipoic acid synthetase
VVEAKPFVLNHNIETVPRLYRRVRPKARYERSLALLAAVKELDAGMLSKSGMMLGLGETREEVRQVLADLRGAGCDVVTIGQYLRPSQKHLPVERFVPPEEFAEIAAEGMQLGFRHIEAGPLVRSSYHAHRQVGLKVRDDDLMMPLEAASEGNA